MDGCNLFEYQRIFVNQAFSMAFCRAAVRRMCKSYYHGQIAYEKDDNHFTS